MTYKNFSTEDFVQDKRFRQWVLQPDKASNIFWHAFLSANPEKLTAVKQAKAIVLGMQFPELDLSETDIAQMWDNIKQTNLSGQPADAPSRQDMPLNPIAMVEHKARKQARWSHSHVLKIAASFVGILLLSAIGYFYFWNGTQYHTYQAAYNETRTIVLPDSSVITLNANTTLKVPEQWEAGVPREVWLQGEAFFEIEKQMSRVAAHEGSNRKFLVHTDNLKIEVLGTTFNVNARRNKTQVVLNTGSVKLIGKYRELTMEPGELAELSVEKQDFVKKVVNPGPYSSWKENKLICNGTTLREIVEVMEDRFGVKVTLKEPHLAEIEASGTIPLDDIAVFIAVLQKSIGLDIAQQGDQIIIRGK